jgi:hypothetical protein
MNSKDSGEVAGQCFRRTRLCVPMPQAPGASRVEIMTSGFAVMPV